MSEKGLTKNQVISELSRSSHGKLEEYVDVCRTSTQQDAEFTAHLIAWNRLRGSIRDSQVALPIAMLTVPGLEPEFEENAWAHVALLRPREFEKAYRFALLLRDRLNASKSEARKLRQVPSRKLRRLVESYVRKLEASWPRWQRTAVQHRSTLATLYALGHVSCPDHKYGDILFNGCNPPGSVFEAIAGLSKMSATEAAGVIIDMKVPFQIAQGALGKNAKETDLVLALINRMTPTQFVTNVKMLERLGAKTNPAIRAAFEEAMTRASKSKANVFKTTRAAEALDADGEDNELAEKLRGLQEKQIKAMGGVEGNWLVLGDRSGSMHRSVEVARQIAGTLAKMVTGNVSLVFFDDSPRAFDVTGKPYDEIMALTKNVVAGGSTSIGCGLQWALDRKLEIDGIAVVSDGGENATPYFHVVYGQYAKWSGKQVPVYLYKCDGGDSDGFTYSLKSAEIDLQTFDMNRSTVDFYSLGNIVKTMRTNRYSLVDEVMEMKLLTLADVFKDAGKEVEANVAAIA